MGCLDVSVLLEAKKKVVLRTQPERRRLGARNVGDRWPRKEAIDGIEERQCACGECEVLSLHRRGCGGSMRRQTERVLGNENPQDTYVYVGAAGGLAWPSPRLPHARVVRVIMHRQRGGKRSAECVMAQGFLGELCHNCALAKLGESGLQEGPHCKRPANGDSGGNRRLTRYSCGPTRGDTFPTAKKHALASCNADPFA